MASTIRYFAPAFFLCISSVSSAMAQDVHTAGVVVSDSDTSRADLWVNDATSLGGDTCIGSSCGWSETFTAGVTLAVKSGEAHLEFNDTSSAAFPGRDWKIRINDLKSFLSGGTERFSIEDITAGTIPFTIAAEARENSLWIGQDRQVGFGAAAPQAELHVVDGDMAALLLEQDTSGGWPAQVWGVRANETAIHFYDQTHLTTPIFVETGAASSSLHVDGNSDVGIGTNLPAAALHVRRSDGSAQLFVEEGSGLSAPRTLLNLQNNGRPEIVMANTKTGGEWSFGAGTNFILKQGGVGSASADKTKVFEVKATGDATLLGELTTGGTTCGGGCDRVFTERAIIPARAYAAATWAAGHLPHVGPTPEGAPINVSEKLGGMLNALEHAHVFIERQGVEIAALRAEKAALTDRVARLEAGLAALMAEGRQ